MTEVYWSSDSHWGHKNIIKYCNRPFATKEEIENNRVEDRHVNHMNETMIERWNQTVRPNDIVYYLGDFCFDRRENYAQTLLNRLHGTKHFIYGNHDSEMIKRLNGWGSVQPYLEATIDHTHIVMCHYAFKVWNRSHRGSINLHGHSHNSLTGNDQQLDVGVDAWDFTPVNITDIKRRLKSSPSYKMADYHGQDL